MDCAATTRLNSFLNERSVIAALNIIMKLPRPKKWSVLLRNHEVLYPVVENWFGYRKTKHYLKYMMCLLGLDYGVRSLCE